MFDKFTIESRFMTGIANRIIKRSIKKSMGVDADIQLDSFKFLSDDESKTVSVELNIKGIMSQEDFRKLIETIN